jgi:hypothetical protein
MLSWKQCRSRRPRKSASRSQPRRCLPLSLEPLEARLLLDGGNGRSEFPSLTPLRCVRGSATTLMVATRRQTALMDRCSPIISVFAATKRGEQSKNVARGCPERGLARGYHLRLPIPIPIPIPFPIWFRGRRKES